MSQRSRVHAVSRAFVAFPVLLAACAAAVKAGPQPRPVDLAGAGWDAGQYGAALGLDPAGLRALRDQRRPRGSRLAWVVRTQAVIRAGRGALYPALATVGRGRCVEVIASHPRDHKWLRVDAGNARGWVYADALSRRPIDPRSGRVIEASRKDAGPIVIVDRFDFGLVEFSLAGGGWDAAAYGAAAGLDDAALRRVTAAGRALTPAALERFMAEGGVGAGGE